MSGFNQGMDFAPLLDAAGQWRDSCLIEDGSLLGDEVLWQVETLAELNRAFIQNPQEGSESYSDKLNRQLAQASPKAIRLMAELHWVLLLFPRNIYPATKRSLIDTIWAWSGESLDAQHPLLSDQVLKGAGHAGTAYNTYRWRELTFLINIVEQLKKLPNEERRRVLSDPWVFAEWLATVPREGHRQLRHMLRWILFPDSFENISTDRDKRAILQQLHTLPPAKVKQISDLEVDQALLGLRERLEQETGHPINFYESPWREQWQNVPRSWLLLWNPKYWKWTSFPDDRLRVAKGENVTLRWSTASSQLAEGDTVYMMRLGEPPKGLIARGNVSSPPYEDQHWDEARAAKGETARFVDVTLTDLRDPTMDSYLNLEDLQGRTTDGQGWTPQQSGTEIKPLSAQLIGNLWSELPGVNVRDEQPQSARQEAIAIGRPVNEIFYGPPGTGKTFYLEKHLMPRYEAQARGATSGEWLEQQLSSTSWWETVALALADLNGEATVNDLIIHPYFHAKARVQGRPDSPNLRSTCWSALQLHTVLESDTVSYSREKRQPPLIFDKKPGGRWVFAGDWEEAGAGLREQLALLRRGPVSDNARIRRHQMVTFHQSYSYEDFVEGIRPQTTEGGGITYEVRDGLFKHWCQRARQDPGHRYALFIDEVNRGNVPRIFGELITLIEVDKRAWWDEEGQLVEGVELTLPYSGEKFGVPKNLDIYATMNTADRSIALMDVALRRRFRFRELMPEPKRIPGNQGDGVIPDGEGGHMDLRRLLEALNLRLRYLLHRDQTFGHAYFTSVKEPHELRNVLVYDIIPMLAEYFYDDWSEIRRVLGDDSVAEDQQIITVTALDPSRLFPGSEVDRPEKPDYCVRPPEAITAEAIRKIYETLEGPDD